MHLEHLFQEIPFQHCYLYKKKFLRRHIAEGHCGTHPRETNNSFKIWLQRKVKPSQDRTPPPVCPHPGPCWRWTFPSGSWFWQKLGKSASKLFHSRALPLWVGRGSTEQGLPHLHAPPHPQVYPCPMLPPLFSSAASSQPGAGGQMSPHLCFILA